MSQVTVLKLPKYSQSDHTTARYLPYLLLHHQCAVFGDWILGWTTHGHPTSSISSHFVALLPLSLPFNVEMNFKMVWHRHVLHVC